MILHTVPWVGLQYMIVVFPDHTHFLLVLITKASSEGSDESVHMRSLVRDFEACIHKSSALLKAQTIYQSCGLIRYMSLSFYHFHSGYPYLANC